MPDAHKRQIDPTGDAVENDLDQLLNDVSKITDEVQKHGRSSPHTELDNVAESSAPKPPTDDPWVPTTPLKQTGTVEDTSPQIQSEAEEHTPLGETPVTNDDTDFERAIAIDRVDQQTIDNEIEETISQLHSAERDPQKNGESNKNDDQVETPLPRAAQTILTVLSVINNVFFWVPGRAKNILGYLAISTLILGIILWIFFL